MSIYARTVVARTGVHPNTKCIKCGITAAKASLLPPTRTGIDHPEYCLTRSFYCGNGKNAKHMCANCHRESEIEGAMNAMDRYAKKHGEDVLAKIMLPKTK